MVPKKHFQRIVVASSTAVPPKTEFPRVHFARGIAWSWVTSSTLVSRRAVLCRAAEIPFRRVSKTTFPRRHPIHHRMLEHNHVTSSTAAVCQGASVAHGPHPHPSHAAGIDIGSTSHFVAVPPERDDQPVREFPSFTVDLHALADWLKACRVDVVAMESTGVYWIPLLELLESRGFTVLLVNGRQVKNVSGDKSDVLDCQWLQQLMSYGLLRGAFRPAEQVSVLRSLTRQRTMLLRTQARHVQHMHQALTQINIQLANVIADVVGVTGQMLLRALIAGERDSQVLAQMKNKGSTPASRRAPSACRATGGRSLCSRSSKHWPGSTSAGLRWPSATGRARHRWAHFKCMKVRRRSARSAGAGAMRRRSTCRSDCSRSAA